MRCKSLSQTIVSHFTNVRERFGDMVPNVNQFIYDNADLGSDLEGRLDVAYRACEANNGLTDRLLNSVLGLSYEDMVRESEIIGDPLAICFEDMARCSDDIPDEQTSLLEFYRAYTDRGNAPAEISAADNFFAELVGLGVDDMLMSIGVAIETELKKEKSLQERRKQEHAAKTTLSGGGHQL